MDISKAFDRVWHDGLLYKLKLLGICGSYYNLIQSFLDSRQQRVVLNGQSSKWPLVEAGVPQDSILAQLLFLVYINDLPQGLHCNAKLFANDTSLFSTTTSPAISSSNLNEDLVKITHWAYQWKMSFNPDITKQAQEIIFCRKKNNTIHPRLYFNNTPIQRKFVQKYLGLFLDVKLSFLEHIDEKIKKATVGVNLMRKLNLLLPRSSLLTVYKSFIRPHLDYGDVIYDQQNPSFLINKIESVQCNAALAITGAIRGTSKAKLYQELGFESLKDRRWLRRLCYLYKIVSTNQPAYLYDLILPFQRSSSNKGCNYEPFCRTVSFKNSFLPYAIKEWNKLDSEIRNAKTYASFRKMFLKFIRPIENSTYKIYDPLGIKSLTRLRLGFSHLSEHKFRHNFAGSLNPLCSCSLETESTLHFFLRWQNYTTLRRALMTDLKNINDAIMSLNESDLLHVLLYGSKKFDNNMNISILTATIKFIKDTERFDQHSYSFIHTLINFFFMKSVVLQLGFLS